MSESRTRAENKWREVLSRQRASGLSIAAFCRENAVPASSFFAWKRRLSGGGPAEEVRTPTPGPAAAGVFIEAKLLPARPHRVDPIEVRLRGGRRVRVRPGFDRELLARVVAVLEGRPAESSGGRS